MMRNTTRLCGAMVCLMISGAIYAQPFTPWLRVPPWMMKDFNLARGVENAQTVVKVKLKTVTQKGGEGVVLSTPFGKPVAKDTPISFSMPFEDLRFSNAPVSASKTDASHFPWYAHIKMTYDRPGDVVYLAVGPDADFASKKGISPLLILTPDEGRLFCDWLRQHRQNQRLALAIGKKMDKKLAAHFAPGLRPERSHRPGWGGIIRIAAPLGKSDKSNSWAELMVMDNQYYQRNVLAETPKDKETVSTWSYLPTFMSRKVYLRTFGLDDTEVRNLDKRLAPMIEAAQRAIRLQQSQAAPLRLRLFPYAVESRRDSLKPMAQLGVTAVFTNISKSPVSIILPQDGSVHGFLDPEYRFRVQVVGEKRPLPIIERCGVFHGRYGPESFLEIQPGQSLGTSIVLLPFHIPPPKPVDVSLTYTVSPTTARAISRKLCPPALDAWPAGTYTGSVVSPAARVKLADWPPAAKKAARQIRPQDTGKSQLVFLKKPVYSPIAAYASLMMAVGIKNEGPAIPAELWKRAKGKVVWKTADGKPAPPVVPGRWTYLPYNTLHSGRFDNIHVLLGAQGRPGTYHVFAELAIPGRGCIRTETLEIEVVKNPWVK